jgi:hypothetical protein
MYLLTGNKLLSTYIYIVTVIRRHSLYIYFVLNFVYIVKQLKFVGVWSEKYHLGQNLFAY